MVAAARHVLTDVVQQRGELEQLAVGGAEPVHSARGVEELERERAPPGGRGAPTSCSAGRGPSTASPRIACGSSDQSAASWWPHAVEHDPFAQRPLADRQLVEVEQRPSRWRAPSTRR